MNHQQGIRLGVGVMLVNKDKKVFLGQRADIKSSLKQPKGWQMPQGGVDPGETLTRAAFRELQEEIGCSHAEIIAESQDWYTYRLPEELMSKLWKGAFHSQRQKWFLMRFLGQDQEIRLDASPHPEFDAWCWAEPSQVLEEIIDFKKKVYEQVFQEFAWYFKT